MLEEIPLPLKGVSESLPLDKQGAVTTFSMNNVRPFDTLERRIRLGQRPGLDKKYGQQVGSVAGAVVAMIAVAVIT